MLYSEVGLSLKHPERHKCSFVPSKDGIVQGSFPSLGKDAGLMCRGGPSYPRVSRDEIGKPYTQCCL